MNPAKIQPFVDAFREKQKAMFQVEDAKFWMNGLYTLKALATVLCSDCQYPQRPLLVQQAEQEELTPGKQDQEMAENFKMYATVFNSRRHKKASEIHGS